MSNDTLNTKVKAKIEFSFENDLQRQVVLDRLDNLHREWRFIS